MLYHAGLLSAETGIREDAEKIEGICTNGLTLSGITYIIIKRKNSASTDKLNMRSTKYDLKVLI